ncbi:MAG: hypothetical protein Fur0023_17810 [Bacteroidia bacterium]
MKKVFIIFLITINVLQSQNIKVDTVYKDSVPIKILYDNKIYKLNAGFFTIGTGLFLSNNISYNMKGISLHFNFHTFKEAYMQVGLIRIKDNKSFTFPERKDINVSYFNFLFSPFVIKTENIRFAFIFNPIGITYGGGYKDETYHYTGIIAQDSTNTIQNNYFGWHLYSSVQGVYKFKYDLGLGVDVYAEYLNDQTIIAGVKLCFYFSAAFKGKQTKPAWYYKKNPDRN